MTRHEQVIKVSSKDGGSETVMEISDISKYVFNIDSDNCYSITITCGGTDKVIPLGEDKESAEKSLSFLEDRINKYRLDNRESIMEKIAEKSTKQLIRHQISEIICDNMEQFNDTMSQSLDSTQQVLEIMGSKCQQEIERNQETLNSHISKTVELLVKENCDFHKLINSNMRHMITEVSNRTREMELVVMKQKEHNDELTESNKKLTQIVENIGKLLDIDELSE